MTSYWLSMIIFCTHSIWQYNAYIQHIPSSLHKGLPSCYAKTTIVDLHMMNNHHQVRHGLLTSSYSSLLINRKKISSNNNNKMILFARSFENDEMMKIMMNQGNSNEDSTIDMMDDPESSSSPTTIITEEPKIKPKRDFPLIKEALMIYKQINGDLNIPKSYIIPLDDMHYPEGMRGSALGNIVNNIRNYDIFQEHKEELLLIGFQYNQSENDFEYVRESFLKYKEIYGTLIIPQSFAIRFNDERFPEQMRGKSLGGLAVHIRYNGHYKDFKEELLAIGFDYGKQPKKSRVEARKHKSR